MKRLSVGIFCFLLLCMVFSGCGSKAAYETMASGGSLSRAAQFYDDGAVQYKSASIGSEMETSDLDRTRDTSLSADQADTNQVRKLVKRAFLNLRLEDPSKIEEPLFELMKKYDAWPASTGVYENLRSYSIRVPSPSYEEMLAELTGFGRVIRRSENAEDVTLRYYDLESRLETKLELLKTYQSYLSRARNIEEIMTVESRIADLQQEIDWTGTQLRNLANLVDYSTIDLEVSGPPGTSSQTPPSLGEKMREFFSYFGNVASSAFVVVTGIIIYGIPAALIIILLFWLLFGRIGLLKKLWRLAAKPSTSARMEEP